MGHTNKRLNYIDVAKGILILTVIISHAPTELAQYMYWFHMPAFFFISGLLYKNNFDFKTQFTKFFLPYMAFSFVDILLCFLTSPETLSISNFISYFSKHLYSGKATGGVFWFIPVLFFTKLIFDFLKKNFNNFFIILIGVISYLMAHRYSINNIPEHIVDITLDNYKLWDFDVIFMSLPYYIIGYYAKPIISFVESKITLFLSILGVLIFTYLNWEMEFYYYLNMKFSYYKEPVLDLVVPLLFIILILSLSYRITLWGKYKNLSYIGKNSLVIMYLHNPIGSFFVQRYFVGPVSFLIIGLTSSLIINKYLIDKSDLLKSITKGISTSKKSSREVQLSSLKY